MEPSFHCKHNNAVFVFLSRSEQAHLCSHLAIYGLFVAVCGPDLGGGGRRYLFYIRGIIVLTARPLAGGQAIDQICQAQEILGPEATAAFGRSLE
jgi:hypothetical protein